ncbi:tetratricopeptide repeat protein, partial [bacterium]|nr:tetratricopeptide repeat protein [bacterium]
MEKSSVRYCKLLILFVTVLCPVPSPHIFSSTGSTSTHQDDSIISGTIYSTWQKTPFIAIVADTPETWAGKFAQQPKHNQGILFIFTLDQLQTIQCSKIPFAADVMFINSHNRIISILQNCTTETLAVSPEPAAAALCIPTGFASSNKLELINFMEYPRTTRLRTPEITLAEQQTIAINKLKQQLANHPKCSTCRIVLAEVLLENHQIAEAEQMVLPLTKTTPIPLQSLIILAKTTALQGRFEEAIGLFSQALDLAPNRFSTVFFIEQTLRISKHPAEILVFLKKLLEKHPENPFLISSLCHFYLEWNMLEEARKVLDEKLLKMPDHPDLTRVNGDVHLRSGDLAEAADAYLKYLEAGPY